MTVTPVTGPRVSYAVNLDLSRGPHPASARIECYETATGEPTQDARLALRGWIDRGALAGLASTLDELGRRGARRLLLDCSRVRHIEFGAVPQLAELLSRSAPAGLHLRGLSPHLRDLFRLAGCQEIVPIGLSAAALATLPAARPSREWAS